MAAGVDVTIRPARASGAALADALPIEPGARVLLPRSDIADSALVEQLVARGADVESIVAYRTAEAPTASVTLLETALGHEPAAVILTSGSTARGLLALADRLGVRDRVLALATVCIGPETRRQAAGLGYRIAAEASTQRPGEMADAALGCILDGTAAPTAARDER
jgi:uroporphyrinogen-III synthase